MGPHAHDIIMKRLQNIWRILVLLHHVVLREAHHCTGHSSEQVVQTLRNPYCMPLQMKRYVSPPERWDTHSETSEVPLNLPESSHCHLMLHNYLHVSMMP
jgi:hypothetical protein